MIKHYIYSMKNRDLLIIKYLAEGYKVTQIREQLKVNYSIIISESLIEKILSGMRKQYQAKLFFNWQLYLQKKRLFEKISHYKTNN